MVDDTGKPHFTISDEVARQRVIKADRCSLCGERLLRGRWFVGGPMSAFDPRGAYIDPPMHKECCHYALQVCPYLAAPSYGRRIEGATLREDERRKRLVITDPTVEDDRPVLFVAVMASGQKRIFDELVPGVSHVRFLKPRKPYLRREFWQHGQQLSEAEGRALCLEWLADAIPQGGE